MTTAHTILAVEDDVVMGTLYEAVLTRPGWRVVLAPTIADADRVIASEPVSLVLLDLFLPDGDGRSWLPQFRARPEHARTPVIVVAGSALVEAQVDCYELGADTMLAKPVDPAVLQAAVAGALQRAARHAPPATARPAEAEERRAADGARAVLLAEDDDVVAALVQHRLERERFTILRASDGVAALALARENDLALAILDVMLPGADGFELLKQLRAMPRNAKVPIVMLTGLRGERDVERALSLGADDYVLKPFSPVELTARLNRLLRKR